MEPEEFALWLKAARESHGRSAEHVSTMLRVSVQTVHNWERAKKPVQPSSARYPEIEQAYGLQPGAIRAVLGIPLSGPSLDYWVGRWEQATEHLERVLIEQRALVEYMKAKSSTVNYPDASSARPMLAAEQRPEPFLTNREIDADIAAADDLDVRVAAAKAERDARSTRQADG